MNRIAVVSLALALVSVAIDARPPDVDAPDVAVLETADSFDFASHTLIIGAAAALDEVQAPSAEAKAADGGVLVDPLEHSPMDGRSWRSPSGAAAALAVMHRQRWRSTSGIT